MKISEVTRGTARDQRVIMNKIVTRRQKIAALHAEIDQLQEQLIQVSAENIAWWDGHVPTDYTAGNAEGCSELNIPLPTTVPEKIFVTAAGIFSNVDGVA